MGIATVDRTTVQIETELSLMTSSHLAPWSWYRVSRASSRGAFITCHCSMMKSFHHEMPCCVQMESLFNACAVSAFCSFILISCSRLSIMKFLIQESSKFVAIRHSCAPHSVCFDIND